jgi:hypothetical protein
MHEKGGCFMYPDPEIVRYILNEHEFANTSAYQLTNITCIPINEFATNVTNKKSKIVLFVSFVSNP